MIYQAIVKKNDEHDVLVEINDIEIICFSNQGVIALEEDLIAVDITPFEDIEITNSNGKNKMVTHISGYEYLVTGILDIERGGVDSLIFIEIDDLYDYSFLDKKMVDVNVLRFNLSQV